MGNGVRRGIGNGSRGWGPWRQEWYSICSAHFRPHVNTYYTSDTDGPECPSGRWYNAWYVWALEHKMFRSALDIISAEFVKRFIGIGK
jgi:hypothetical protein